MAARYEALGVDYGVETIPIYKPSRRKNLFVLLLFLLQLPKWIIAVHRLRKRIVQQNVDLIHLNHDGFFPVAAWSRWFWDIPVVCHMRTMLPANAFGRWQARCLLSTCAKLICISPMERERIQLLVGETEAIHKLEVVPNIGGHPLNGRAQSDWLPSDWLEKFKVIWLGNVTPSKGTDRVIDVAQVVKKRGRSDIGFVICGESRHERGAESFMHGLEELVAKHDLSQYVHFTGFVAEPMHLIRDVDVVLRTGRGDDPWGRDVIEGIVMGKPVLATGERSPFVEEGENGYLFAPFSPEAVADTIIMLADDRETYKAISTHNEREGALRFSGETIAAEVERCYEEVVADLA